MKKFLIVLLGIIVLLVVAAIAIPILFKDKIKAKVDSELAKSINAKVFYDADKFSLSLLKRFPNATVSMEDFGIVGKGEFEGDTLTSMKSLQATINLFSLFGDKINISGIEMKDPRILIRVLENGMANYDIAIADTTAAAGPEEPSEFNIGIDKWVMENGYIVYDDRSLKTYVEMSGVDHTGSGDFTQDIFDMKTKTEVKSMTADYEGIRYLDKNKVDMDMTLLMDMPNFKFTFKDNKVVLNNFPFGFDGWFAMPKEDMDMDIRFEAKETDFKNLISLVPGVFLEGYEKLKAEGKVAFNGFVKGTYNETKMPAFNLVLKVDDGMMQYPDLPTAIRNINMDMLVDNKDGIIDNTLIDIKKFHLDMGNNPIDGRVKIQGLNIMDVDANILAKLNLAELNTMFPMEGLSMRGTYNLDLKAKGIYQDSVRIPVIDAKMSLANGFVKSADFPIPLEQVNFNSLVTNTSGKIEETKILIENFNMVLENERLEARAALENLNDYTWDVWVKGGMDLEKLTKVYPIEGMKLAGKLKANIETKGKMSDLDASRYDKMPTSGTMSVADFRYETTDMPPVTISSGEISFNPQSMVISNTRGFAGKSDFSVDGSFTNYIAYVVKPDETIKGKLNFRSNSFDVNEWMSEEETPAIEDTAALEPVEIPKNIDFVLNSKIDKVIYDNMTMENLTGNIIMRDGMVKLDQVTFNTLGGTMGLNGTYDAADIRKPKFDFAMSIKNMNIKSAYETFNSIQTLAPVAKKLDGNFSTDFKLNGLLGRDMMPVYTSLTGGGLINVIQAAVKDLDLINKVNAISKITKGAEGFGLKDLKIQAEVKDGRVVFKPFDINAGDQKFTIGGSQGVDGTVDYNVKTEVPAGKAGEAVSGLISKNLGKDVAMPKTIKVNMKVTGTYKDMNVAMGKAEPGEPGENTGVKDAVKDVAKDEIDAKKKEAEELARKEKEEAERKAREEAERLKKESEDKLKKEADKLKDKFGFPKKKKKDSIQ
jgi:hypothetical protein